VRPLLLALPAALAALVPAPAAPAPDDAAPPIFPTAVGTKWVYRDDPQEWSEEITADETRGGATVITVEKKMLKAGGTGSRFSKIAVARDGLFMVEHDGVKENPPSCWLKLPAEPGVEWIERRIHLGWEAQSWVLDRERVTVPAGSYRAIPVVTEMRWKAAFVPLETTTWFAPGVGLVKTRGATFEVVLLSFTPGRR
jgi:hypothetical protein